MAWDVYIRAAKVARANVIPYRFIFSSFQMSSRRATNKLMPSFRRSPTSHTLNGENSCLLSFRLFLSWFWQIIDETNTNSAWSKEDDHWCSSLSDVHNNIPGLFSALFPPDEISEIVDEFTHFVRAFRLRDAENSFGNLVSDDVGEEEEKGGFKERLLRLFTRRVSVLRWSFHGEDTRVESYESPSRVGWWKRFFARY